MTEQLIEKLKKLAEKSCWADKIDGDKYNIDDYAGGNVDDAYFGGYNSGEILLARDILTEMGMPFTETTD